MIASLEEPDGRTKTRVLVVDDEWLVRETVAMALSQHGFAVEAVGTPEEALRALRDLDIGAIVVDVIVPGADAVELVSAARRLKPGIAVVVVSGDAAELSVAAEGLQADAALSKPFSMTELTDAVVRTIGLQDRDTLR